MSGLKGWYKVGAIMPASPGAKDIRDALSRMIVIDEITYKPQEFARGFNVQPGGKFGATYVTDNLQHIADAAAEPSILLLFVQDMGNGLHLGETYELVDPDDHVRVKVGTPIYTPHPTYELFIAGGLTKEQAFYVNDMFGVPR